MFQPELAGIRIEKIQGMRILDKKNNGEDLTFEEAKEFEFCKNLTDEQIKELMEAVKIFTEIVYATFAKKKGMKEKPQEENDDINLAA